LLETAEWDVAAGSDYCEQILGGTLGPLCAGEVRFDMEQFAPQQSVRVFDSLWMKAMGNDSDVTFFSSTNRFNVVPEPATGTLLMLGLLGLAIRRRGF
jgi:hypothetical protein